jgi:hypothetical protein
MDTMHPTVTVWTPPGHNFIKLILLPTYHRSYSVVARNRMASIFPSLTRNQNVSVLNLDWVK